MSASATIVTPPVYEMKVSALPPDDVMLLTVVNDGRRLTILPEIIEVTYWKPKRADARLYVTVRGSLVRQSDGQLTTIRRVVSFRFPDDVGPGYQIPFLDAIPSLDDELIAFAHDARRRIEAAVSA